MPDRTLTSGLPFGNIHLVLSITRTGTALLTAPQTRTLHLFTLKRQFVAENFPLGKLVTHLLHAVTELMSDDFVIIC